MIFNSFLVIGIVTLGCIIGASFLGIPVLNFLYGVDLSKYKAALYLILISGGFTALYQLLQIFKYYYETSIQYVCVLWNYSHHYIFYHSVSHKEICNYGCSLPAISISIGVMSVLFLVFFVYYLIRDKKKQSEEKHE